VSVTQHSPIEQDRLLREDLERVEKRIAEVIGSQEPRLSEVSDYLINAGGKRVRPAVALLTFRACGGDDPTDVIDLSVALELIHTATLLHDDIIDANSTRRGKEAAYLRYGLADTLVAGDFLFCRAFDVCGRFEERIVAWAAGACVQLTEGEIMQARYRRNEAVTVDHYLEIIDRKTASLFRAGTRIASFLAGQNEEEIERMGDCGKDIGLAFQMVDDILDVEGDTEKTGKMLGTDLRDGNPSLPTVWALDDAAVRHAFTNDSASDAEVETALSAIRSGDVISRVRSLAAGHVESALETIGGLPESIFSQRLADLAGGLLTRVS